ncbi:radical SAM protein, partial [bacterium]|nr:radical SAM protein [bacterium]
MIQYHRRPFKLREIKIEVTYRCPLACIHCSSDATPSSSLEMSREECLQIIHEAIQMGAEEVAFSGGEPLIWPGLDEAIDAAVCGGLHVIIYTSGNIPKAGGRIEHLAKLGVNTFIFSIFSA